MTDKIAINPKRLKWCMNEIGINFEQLSPEINISKKALESATLSINQLEKIANYFKRGLLFFIDPADVNEDALYSSALNELIKNGKI